MPDRGDGLRTRVIRGAARRKLLGDGAEVEPVYVDDYTLLELVGEGGMGEVFAAYDPELDRRVAIKLLRPTGDTPSEGERYLMREARAMAQLEHPNVVGVYRVGRAQGRVFIAMQYVQAGTLRAYLAAADRSARDIVAVFAAAGDGLAAAHAAGLVHRDFKPDNVLVDDAGHPRVTDFGLVLSGGEADAPPEQAASDGALPTATSVTHRVAGTPAYMAPEQHAGERADRRTDVYAFCASLYEALYERVPFTSEHVRAGTADHVAAKLADRLELPDDRDVPAHVREVLRRGLRAAPDERYDSMDALLSELRRDPSRARRRVAVAVGVAGGVAALGVLAYLGYQPADEPCAAVADDVRALWTADASARVDAAFAAVEAELAGPDVARAALARVSPAVDAYATALADAATSACDARERRRVSADLADATATCLDHRAAALAALVAELERADAETVENSVSAVAALPSIADCDNPALVRRPDLVALSPENRAAVLALDNRVIAASVRIALGRLDGVADELDAILEQATAAGSDRVMARAELARARMLSVRGWNADAVEAGRAALGHAERAGDDDTAIETLILLIPAEADDSGRDTARIAKRLVDAKIARTGGDSERALAAELAWVSTLYEDFPSKARAQTAELRGDAERVFGDPSIELATLLRDIARIDLRLSEYEAAVGHFTESVDMLTSILGSGHPSVARVRLELASPLYTLMRGADALEQLDLAERALARAHLSPSQRINKTLLRARVISLVPGREQEALDLMDTARTIEDVGPRGDRRYPLSREARVEDARADLLFRLGRLDEADAAVARALAVRSENWSPGLWMATPVYLQVTIEIARGTCQHIPERLALLAEVAGDYRTDEAEHPEGVVPQVHCDLVAGKTAGAVDRLRGAIEALERRGTRPVLLASFQLYLAGVIVDTAGDLAEARALLERARPVLIRGNAPFYLERLEALERRIDGRT